MYENILNNTTHMAGVYPLSWSGDYIDEYLGNSNPPIVDLSEETKSGLLSIYPGKFYKFGEISGNYTLELLESGTPSGGRLEDYYFSFHLPIDKTLTLITPTDIVIPDRTGTVFTGRGQYNCRIRDKIGRAHV